jgi:hypothetical protein
LILPTLLTSQTSVLPGAQVSLADTGFGARGVLEAQASSMRTVANIKPVFSNDTMLSPAGIVNVRPGSQQRIRWIHGAFDPQRQLKVLSQTPGSRPGNTSSGF